MKKKRGRPPKGKKKGRPKKSRKVDDGEEERLQSSRSNGGNMIQETGNYGSASSSPNSGRRFEAKRSDPLISNVPDEDSFLSDRSDELHSQHENTCSEKTTNDVLDLKKFTLDLLAQSSIPSSAEDIIMFNNNLSEKNKVITSQLDNSSGDFDRYKVKGEMAPLLKSIFAKHGDIVKESTFSLGSRYCLLELVCTIYERLKASKLMQLKPLEMESMLGQIGDLEIVNVKIGWLRRRLDLIVKAKELCEGASTLEEAEARTVKAIDEKLKAVESFEKKLKVGVADVERLQRRIRDAKGEVVVLDEIMNLFCGSLVDGLV